jgi:UDP-glucuronate 4-epimerase
VKVLITGVTGFIGYHLSLALLERQYYVTGIDNINNYYDPELKNMRLKNIVDHKNSCNFNFIKLDISNRDNMDNFFRDGDFDIVIHLAAQAGVRYSIENPNVYVDSNLTGFVNIIEGCRKINVKHFIFASSSSVYGLNSKQPFSTSDNVDYPISLYAATKKANELIAHSYSHLYDIPSTGLRFFTVYGPYGRPDMAYFKFTKAIHNEEPIDVYNNGDMKRDFTYIDDIVEGIIRTMQLIPKKTSNPRSHSNAPYKIYNIGNNQPISLRRFISAIESSVGKKAIENLLPIQAGDVTTTYADIDDFMDKTGFKPETSIEVGIEKFVKWYLSEYIKKK